MHSVRILCFLYFFFFLYNMFVSCSVSYQCLSSHWIRSKSYSVSRLEVVGSDRTWVLFVVFILCYLYSLVKMDSGVLLYLV